MLLGMESVEDLDCTWEHLLSEVPDPGCTVTDNDSPRGLTEPSTARFTVGSLSEIGGGVREVAIVGSRALDGGRVGCGSRVASRKAVLVAGLGAPNHTQFDFARAS